MYVMHILITFKNSYCLIFLKHSKLSIIKIIDFKVRRNNKSNLREENFKIGKNFIQLFNFTI